MMIKVNLLPAGSIKKEERKEILLLAYLVVAVIVLFGVTRYTLKFISYKKLQAKTEIVNRELSKYESIVRQVEALKTTKGVLELRKNIINSLLALRLVYPQFMEELLHLIPTNVWFLSMETKTEGDTSLTVTVNAESLDNNSIADFISNLSSSARFTDIELGTINTTKTEKAQTSNFKLTFKYKK